MKIFYDFEFIEDGRTIDPISLGMVRDDGTTYYAVFSDAPWERVRQHPWLMENVVPRLPQAHGDARNHLPRSWLFDLGHKDVKPRTLIAHEVRDFIAGAGGQVQLWADYAAYDHVALAQLWGPMAGLPDGVPMYTNDIRQEAARLGVDTLPAQRTAPHHALNDAFYAQGLWTYLFHSSAPTLLEGTSRP